MEVSKKYICPIFGLKHSLKNDIKIDGGLLLRNIDLINNEYKIFEKHGLLGDYKVVLEIDYTYDHEAIDEPFPGIFVNVVNKFDSALCVYETGVVGIAGTFPAAGTEFSGGMITYSGKVIFSQASEIVFDAKFVRWFLSFGKAYDLRPVAFDTFRRSQGRFSNNDKTIDNNIVLESVFVPRDERQKKSFILNGMRIMGFSTTDVGMVDKLIDYRNAIIHADRKRQLDLLHSGIYTHEWFDQVFEIVRKILKQFAKKPWIE